MTGMANASSGNFYDVDSPEKLPLVFEAELEGALRISIQNLRVRVRKEDFCDSWRDLAELKRVPLPDGRRELLVGDLVSEEERSFAISIRVLPIPLAADGSQVASLEGEKVLSLEFAYDLVGDDELISRKEERAIRLSATQNADEVKVDESVLPIVSAQKTSRAVRKAIEELDRNRHHDALHRLEKMLTELEAFNRQELVEDSVKAIKSMIENIRSGWYGTRGRKNASYSSRSLGRRSSKEYWSGSEEARPSFKDDPRAND
jgi:Ca-activated chloride channel family protein